MICENCGKEMSTHDGKLYHCYNCDLYHNELNIVNKKSEWFNYVTNKYEYIETPTDFSDYVPQIGGHGLYQVYVKCGISPIKTAYKVLTIAIEKGQ